MTQTSFIFAHSLCQIVVASGYVEPKTNVVKVAGLSNPTRLRLPIIYVKQDKSTSAGPRSLLTNKSTALYFLCFDGQQLSCSANQASQVGNEAVDVLETAKEYFGSPLKATLQKVSIYGWVKQLTWPTYWSFEIHLVCLSTQWCLKAICLDIMPKISIDLDPPHPIVLDAIWPTPWPICHDRFPHGWLEAIYSTHGQIIAHYEDYDSFIST